MDLDALQAELIDRARAQIAEAEQERREAKVELRAERAKLAAVRRATELLFRLQFMLEAHTRHLEKWQLGDPEPVMPEILRAFLDAPDPIGFLEAESSKDLT